MIYDRHFYRIYLTDGRFFDFLDYEYMRAWWMHHKHTGLLSTTEVIDVTEEVQERITEQKKLLGLD